MHADATPHQFHQALAQCQADAGALDHPGLLAQTLKGLEDMAELLGTQATTTVFNADADAALPGVFKVHPHRATFAVVLDGIAEDVDEDLLEAGAVRDDRATVVKLRKAQVDATRCGKPLHHRLAVVQHLGQPDRLQHAG